MAKQIVYNQLDYNEVAIWSLLVAGGYLKILEYDRLELIDDREPMYTLALTNNEVKHIL